MCRAECFLQWCCAALSEMRCAVQQSIASTGDRYEPSTGVSRGSLRK